MMPFFKNKYQKSQCLIKDWMQMKNETSIFIIIIINANFSNNTLTTCCCCCLVTKALIFLKKAKNISNLWESNIDTCRYGFKMLSRPANGIKSINFDSSHRNRLELTFLLEITLNVLSSFGVETDFF